MEPAAPIHELVTLPSTVIEAIAECLEAMEDVFRFGCTCTSIWATLQHLIRLDRYASSLRVHFGPANRAKMETHGLLVWTSRWAYPLDEALRDWDAASVAWRARRRDWVLHYTTNRVVGNAHVVVDLSVRSIFEQLLRPRHARLSSSG